MLIGLSSPAPLSFRGVALLFTGLVGVLAVWTGLAQLALIAGFSFLSLEIAFTVAIVMGAIALGIWVWRNRQVRQGWRWSDYSPDYGVLVGLLLLSLVCGTVALGALTSSGDDVSYVSRVVYFTSNPQAKLDFALHDNILLSDRSYFVMLFSTIELLWGYLTAITGSRFTDVYYYWVPFLGGCLIPLVWFFLFSKLSPNSRSALLATIGVLVILSISVITNKSFGYIAFLRIWQGKAILMSIFMPLFTAYSLEFFQTLNKWTWLRLFLALIACLGLSASSLFLIPSLAIVLGLGYVACVVGKSVQPLGLLKVLLTYYSIFAPLIVAGHFYVYWTFEISFLELIQRGGIPSEQLNLFFSDRFLGQYESVFGNRFGLLSIAFLLTLIATVWIVNLSTRRFLIGWLIGAIAFFLNPFLFPIISRSFTTDNAYWRLFYTLPFPFVVGVLLIYTLKNIEALRAPRLAKISEQTLFYTLLGGLLGLAIVLNAVPNRYALFQQTDFAFFHHKIDPTIYRAVERIVRISPPGAMLAPFDYSQKIPIYSANHPQVATHFHLLLGSTHPRDRETINSAIRAIAYISNPRSTYIQQYVLPLEGVGSELREEGVEDFRSLLSSLPLRTVVLSTKMRRMPAAEAELRDRQFEKVYETQSYYIYVKNDSTDPI